MAGNSAPRGAAARLPQMVPRFLISLSAIRGKACASSECRWRVRKKTSRLCCRQHAPTVKSSCNSTKSKLRTPLISTRCSGLNRPLWINGRRVCPPAKIRARDPHSERTSSTSSIDVGALYVNIRDYSATHRNRGTCEEPVEPWKRHISGQRQKSWLLIPHENHFFNQLHDTPSIHLSIPLQSDTDDAGLALVHDRSIFNDVVAIQCVLHVKRSGQLSPEVLRTSKLQHRITRVDKLIILIVKHARLR